MQYIVKGEMKWDLLATRNDKGMNFLDSLIQDGCYVHFTFSRLKESVNGIQAVNTRVISLDLAGKKFWGPYNMGWHRIGPFYDVTDAIHVRSYCKEILRLKASGEKEERIWLAVQRTGFIPSLSYEEWLIAFELLNEIRKKRIENRTVNPRVGGGDKLADDWKDIFLSEVISKANSILREMLYWGKMEKNDSRIKYSDTPFANS